MDIHLRDVDNPPHYMVTQLSHTFVHLWRMSSPSRWRIAHLCHLSVRGVPSHTRDSGTYRSVTGSPRDMESNSRDMCAHLSGTQIHLPRLASHVHSLAPVARPSVLQCPCMRLSRTEPQSEVPGLVLCKHYVSHCADSRSSSMRLPSSFMLRCILSELGHSLDRIRCGIIHASLISFLPLCILVSLKYCSFPCLL